jgi:hypothetical protein
LYALRSLRHGGVKLSELVRHFYPVNKSSYMYDLKLVNTDMDWHRDSRLRITKYDGTSEISFVVYVTLRITSLWILCTNMDTA